MLDDKRRWDQRYAGRSLAAPTMPEALHGRNDLLDLIASTGRALDVACGDGSQSLWLAQRGLSVVALDVSPVAIELTRSAATSLGVGNLIDARVHDLDDGLPNDLRDVDVVVCQRFRGRGVYPQLIDALRSGGIAIVTVLSVVGLDGEPGQFHAVPGELLDCFDRADIDVLAHDEASGLASLVVRRQLAPVATSN